MEDGSQFLPHPRFLWLHAVLLAAVALAWAYPVPGCNLQATEASATADQRGYTRHGRQEGL